MPTSERRYQGKFIDTWILFSHRLVYLPGAVVLIYGFWLSLTA
ncbi:MAG: hypothetical protein WBO58_16365 [Gammaproteobacteria bacterium]|jgi:hypothetical protein